MDKGQIIRDYRMAKNHKKQIPILAELNICDKQTIIEILNEVGYKQVFNTNGVDLSVKRAEIEKRYAAGEDISVLAAVYHISKKQIKLLLGVEDTEEDKKMDNTPKGGIDVERLEKENREMKDHIEELKCQVKELTAKNDELQANMMVLEDEQRHDDGLYEKYQTMCIKCNQLSTTVDVLIDKINIIKAVRGDV